MKKLIITSLVASSCLLNAQEMNIPKYEIVPMIGKVFTKDHVDIKNHNTFGISVLRDSSFIDNCKFDQFELGLIHTQDAEYEKTNIETDITRAFVNGIKNYGINDHFSLYALAGLGYEKIGKELLNNESDPFFNYGVGTKLQVNDSIAFKLDARHLLKFDGDKNILMTLGLAFALGEGSKPQAPVAKEEVVKKTVMQKTALIADLDDDNDGVKNSIDNCPSTKSGIRVDSIGCGIYGDDDRDGVQNQDDQCLSTPLNTKVDSIGCTIEETVEEKTLTIYFDSDNPEIRAEDQLLLNEYANYLDKYSSLVIEVKGYADATGSESYNKVLSEKRATNVMKYLVENGIEESRISISGYGESQPLVTNDSPKNRAMNRRVILEATSK